MSVALAPSMVAAVLALAALLAMLRLLRRRHRLQRVRIAALLLAQPLLAGLLYLALFPPMQGTAAGTLAVLSAGASAPTPGEPRVALPEAPRNADAEPTPDLASALRRHPGTRRLHVVGAGLEARDLEIAGAFPTTFTPGAAPVGLVDLQAPARVAAGNAFQVQGRIGGLPAATVELHDPAGQRAQRVTVDAQGRFALRGEARTAGLATFSLQVADRNGRIHEVLPLPMQIDAPPQPRVLMLAGAPTPEVKYLRRWATDAGIGLHARISTGGGLSLGDAPIALGTETLRRFDAVVLDIRSLRALGGGELAALTTAIREGLGVVLRIDEPLLAPDRARARGWGYALAPGPSSEPVQLPGNPALPALTRRVLTIDGDDAVPILRDARERSIATWRAVGRGRVAVLTLDDSYRLVLDGHPARHAQLWSAVLAAVARTGDATALALPAGPAWPDERIALCGLGEDASVLEPGGNTVALVIDPATGSRRCAAFWPRAAGWHVLRQGDTAAPFAVLPTDAGLALRAQRRRDATVALAARPAGAPAARAEAQRGPSWPWLAAWLLLATLAWWLERRRPATDAAVPAATIA